MTEPVSKKQKEKKTADVCVFQILEAWLVLCIGVLDWTDIDHL